jgi:hypothetical protein
MSGIAQTAIKICNDPELQNIQQDNIESAKYASRTWRV